MEHYDKRGTPEAFARSVSAFDLLTATLSGQPAGAWTHAELEEHLRAAGRAMMRQLLQDHHDLRAMREHPADVLLSLPAGRHSMGLRRLAVTEAVRGSFDQALAAVRRQCGTVVGKRRRSGDIESPRTSGSTSARSASRTAGFRSTTRLRPPPGRRMRSNGASPEQSSRMPADTVASRTPAARATALIPPWPRDWASAPINRRR